VRNWRGLGGAVLLAALLSPLATATGPAGAVPPDPGAAGAYGVTTMTYDLGDTAFLPTGWPATDGVEVTGETDYPSTIAGLGSLPLVVIMHGDHQACYQGTAMSSTGWPCPPSWLPIPSYEGFHYLAAALASDGFVVVSISTNGIHVHQGTDSTDGGLMARAELAEHTLDMFETADTTLTDPFGSAIGTTFYGHVDLSDVGVIGHSRGGGAAAALVAYNTSRLAPYGIRALQLLSPLLDTTNLPSLSDVAIDVMESYCDGNAPLTGVGYLDQQRYPGVEAPRSLIWTMGGNHFYWDTVQTTSPYPTGLPPIQDDWSTFAGGAYAGDPWCATSASTRLTPAGQQEVASDYTRAYFRWQLLGDISFEPYFTGAAAPPPSVNGADLEVDWIPPQISADRLDVNSFASASNLSVDDLGGAVTISGSVSVCGPPGSCVSGSTPSQQEPHTYWGQVTQANARWSGPGTEIDNALDATRNLLGGSILLRVGVDSSTSQPVPDFDVTVTDDLGHSASAPVSSSVQPLFLPPGSAPTILPRETLQTIDLPLTDFSGVDVARVRSIDLDFDRTASGSLLLADLMITGTTAPIVKGTGSGPSVPLVLWVPFLPPGVPVESVLTEVAAPLDAAGAPVVGVSTSGPFFAGALVGPGPASGCAADCAADVSFTPPAGTEPGTYQGSLTFIYADGTTAAAPLLGHVSSTIPPTCALSGNATFAPALRMKPRSVATKMTITGTLSGCVGRTATRLPVTGGTIRLVATLPPGATCALLPAPSQSSVTIAWKGINHRQSIVTLEKDTSTIASLRVQADPAPAIELDTGLLASPGAFVGTAAHLDLIGTDDADALAAACASGLSSYPLAPSSDVNVG
jgi:hypothetical protein